MPPVPATRAVSSSTATVADRHIRHAGLHPTTRRAPAPPRRGRRLPPHRRPGVPAGLPRGRDGRPRPLERPGTRPPRPAGTLRRHRGPRPTRRPGRPPRRCRDAGRTGRRGGRRLAGGRDRGGPRRPRGADGRARTAVPLLGRIRRRRRRLPHPVRSRRHRRPGLGRDAAAHVLPLGREARLLAGAGRRLRGDRGGPQLRRVHHPGPLRLRPTPGRTRRPPVGPHLAVQQGGQAPDGLRLAACRPLRRGRRRRDPDRGGRPADRHLPLLGGRRTACQRDRFGSAHHPPAHRAGDVLPERAQPAPEQGPGHADAGGQAARPRTPEARGGTGGGQR